MHSSIAVKVEYSCDDCLEPKALNAVKLELESFFLVQCDLVIWAFHVVTARKWTILQPQT